MVKHMLSLSKVRKEGREEGREIEKEGGREEGRLLNLP